MGSVELPRRVASITRNTNETKIQLSLSLDGGPLDLLEPTAEFPANCESKDGLHPPQTEKTHASQEAGSQNIWIWTGIGKLKRIIVRDKGNNLRKYFRISRSHASRLGEARGMESTNTVQRGSHKYERLVPSDIVTDHAQTVDCHHTTEDTFLALGSAFKQALGPRTGIKRFGSGDAILDEALARVVLDISSRPFFVGKFGFQNATIGTLDTQMINHGLDSWTRTAEVSLNVNVEQGENDHHRAESAFKALALACKKACKRVKGKEGEVISTKGVL